MRSGLKRGDEVWGLMEEHGSRNVDEKKPNENNGRDKTKV